MVGGHCMMKDMKMYIKKCDIFMGFHELVFHDVGFKDVEFHAVGFHDVGMTTYI